jgi:hypothetical protein
VRKTIRRSGHGLNVVADVNAVLATGDAVSSATTTTVVQHSPAARPGRVRAKGEH